MTLRPDLLALLQQPDRVDEIPQDVIPALLGELEALRVQLLARFLVSYEPSASIAHSESPPDRLLTPDETARLLGTTVGWVYRHHKRLPFAKQLSRKVLRFSETGLHQWLAARQGQTS